MRRDTKSKKDALQELYKNWLSMPMTSATCSMVTALLQESTAAGYCNKLIKQHKGSAVKIRLGL